jgi:hypothetical protein
MEGMGLGAGLGLLFAGLFEWWKAQSIAWLRLGPVEQNLRRASHGAVLVLLPLFAIFECYGAPGFWDFFLWLAHDPAAAWPGVLLAAALVCGFVRCVVGINRLRGFPGDWLLASQAFIKFAAGGGAAWLLSSNAVAGMASNLAAALVWVALIGYALKWAVVGGVRFLLTLGIGGGNARRAINKQIRRNQTILGRPPGWRPPGPGVVVAALVAAIGGAVWFLIL